MSSPLSNPKTPDSGKYIIVYAVAMMVLAGLAVAILIS